MTRKCEGYNFWKFALKTMVILSPMVWLSSYIQLQLLSSWQLPLITQKIACFWIMGLAIDVATLVFFILISLISEKFVSSLSFSLPFYLLAVLIHGAPTIFVSSHLAPLLQSFLKVAELWFLGCLHLLLSTAIPEWLHRQMGRKNNLG